MTTQETREQKATALRYRRPALADLGYYSLITGLYEIVEEANNALYYIGEDDGSDGGLLAASDGDDELANEFAVAFGDIAAKAEELRDMIDGYDVCVDAQVYDDCTCALIGNRHDMVGYDSMQEDYYALCGYETELAETEAGKRLMRLTKAEMLSTIGQCMGVAMAYQDLRLQYEYLKAAMDVQIGINMEQLKIATSICEAYDAEDWRRLQRLTAQLPERVWCE